ncbi:MAG TPA: PhnA-like protein [Bauldia sp.]|nr:PhnA-like protein [Bauldia sp.]
MSNPDVSVEINERIAVARPLSWRAVIAGVVVALVVQLLLSILGGAIGLAFVNPTTVDNPSPMTATIIGAIWWTLSGILAAWAGGITAGRLSGMPASGTAAWHGLVAWAVTTLVIFFLLASAIGGIVGGAFSVLGSAASGLGQAAAAAAPAVANLAGDPFGSVETAINDTTGAKDPAAARTAVIGYVRSAFTADQAGAQPAMDRAGDALARASGLSPEEAKAKLADWKAQYDQAVATAKQKAADAANAARKAASAAGILSVIALVFGALAGWYGGWHSPVPTDEAMYGRFVRRMPGIVPR